jgi:hypothetical protein
MVQSHSNLGTDQSLDVIIVDSGPLGESEPWFISITSSGFPDSKMINIIQSKDQQLVDFEKVIKEFIAREDKETKLEFAKFLERMAKSIKSSA